MSQVTPVIEGVGFTVASLYVPWVIIKKNLQNLLGIDANTWRDLLIYDDDDYIFFTTFLYVLAAWVGIWFIINILISIFILPYYSIGIIPPILNFFLGGIVLGVHLLPIEVSILLGVAVCLDRILRQAEFT